MAFGSFSYPEPMLLVFSDLWYDIPQTGVYPSEVIPEGTFIPSKLTDSNVTFYHGAGRLEYMFINAVKTTDVFKSELYSTVIVLLIFGFFLNTCTIVNKKNSDIRLLITASAICVMTLLLATVIAGTGIPFGGRYANIFLTLLSLVSLLNLLFTAIAVSL